MNMISHVLAASALITAFAAVGILMWISGAISKYLTFGRIHASAIAIMLGLALAFFGGLATGGEKGVADLPVLAGIGLMGGAMLRDFAIVATAFEVDVVQARKPKRDRRDRAWAGNRRSLHPRRICRRGIWLYRCRILDHDRCWRRHLHRWAGHRSSNRSILTGYCAFDRDRCI
jgi:Malonate/sodium symporter MadM subunit